MPAWLQDRITRILLQVFVWSGSKLFHVICSYTPGGVVKAIHFGTSEVDLERSISEMYHEKILR